MTEGRQFAISDDEYHQIGRKLVSCWVYKDIPHNIESAVSSEVANQLKESGEWEQLALEIAALFESRRQEIAQRVTQVMIEQLSGGIAQALSTVTSQLADKLQHIRFR